MSRDRTPADGAGVYTAWKEFGAPTTFTENPLVTVVGVTATQVLQANPNRVAIMISVWGTNNVFFAFNKGVTATNGFIQFNGLPTLILTVHDLGELVTSELWAIAAGAGGGTYVVEVVGQP